MTPEVTKTVLNKIILNVLDRKWTRDRASISVQQLRINDPDDHIVIHKQYFGLLNCSILIVVLSKQK
jgi:hypothetical protein